MKNVIFKILLCFILIPILLFSVAGCSTNDINTDLPNPSEDNTFNPEPSNTNEGKKRNFSYNFEDYIGDFETFTYGLITNQLGYLYDVFPAYVQLSTSEFVYGLGYTDYSECYTNDAETEVYFLSGFITFCGEFEVTQEDFDSGLFIYNLENPEENTFFVWKYKSDNFYEHCVVFGHYLKYGVINGQIFYSSKPYTRGNCDESLGSLYSYDEERFVLDLEVGTFIPIAGISTSLSIDYRKLEQDINDIINKQDLNLCSIDVKSIAYISKNAIDSYLLSLQVESFFGFDVDTLIEASRNLDPLECFRITSSGITIIDIEKLPPPEPSAFIKWLVGSCCAIVAAVGIVGSVITMECPFLSAACGALTGTAISIFTEVVISNKSLKDIDWRKVGISAVSGAVSGLIGPYLQTLGGVGYFFVDSAIDGIISGVENAVYAWMEGAQGQKIAESFGWGVLTGCAISAAFKGVSKVVSSAGKSISKQIKKITKDLSPKLTENISKFTKPFNKAGNWIGDKITFLKKKVDSTIFHSKYIGKKVFFKQVNKFATESLPLSDKLAKDSMNKLKNSDILDLNGKSITKTELFDIFCQSTDGDMIGKYNLNGEIVGIIKKNGAIGISFDTKYQTVILKNKSYNLYESSSVRNENMLEATSILKSKWINDGSIPDDIRKSLEQKFKNTNIKEILESINDKDLLDNYIRKSSWVLHENLDLSSVSLVPKKLHSTKFGGVSHYGGAALEVYIKQHMGFVYFEKLITAAYNGFMVGA